MLKYSFSVSLPSNTLTLDTLNALLSFELFNLPTTLSCSLVVPRREELVEFNSVKLSAPSSTKVAKSRTRQRCWSSTLTWKVLQVWVWFTRNIPSEFMTPWLPNIPTCLRPITECSCPAVLWNVETFQLLLVGVLSTPIDKVFSGMFCYQDFIHPEVNNRIAQYLFSFLWNDHLRIDHGSSQLCQRSHPLLSLWCRRDGW